MRKQIIFLFLSALFTSNAFAITDTNIRNATVSLRSRMAATSDIRVRNQILEKYKSFLRNYIANYQLPEDIDQIPPEELEETTSWREFAGYVKNIDVRSINSSSCDNELNQIAASSGNEQSAGHAQVITAGVSPQKLAEYIVNGLCK